MSLPAPVGGSGDSARYEAQAREIVEACRIHGAGPRETATGEPQDEIPLKFRLDQARGINYYAGPSKLLPFAQRGNIILLALVAVSLYGLGGCIHTCLRDLPAYNSYRSVSPCQAAFVGDGVGPHYCSVTDGVVEQPMKQPVTGLYEVVVGPVEQSADENSVEMGDTVSEIPAFFGTDQPALEKLVAGQRVDYVADNYGDKVLSVTVGGVTYQTVDSAQLQSRSQYVDDWASVFEMALLVLVFAGVLVMRLCRRRLVDPWAVVPVALIAAFLASCSADGDGSTTTAPTSVAYLLWVIGIVAACTAAGLALSGRLFRRRARRPVSRRHRALP